MKLKAEDIERKILFFQSSLNPLNQQFLSQNQREFWYNDFSTVLKEIRKMKEEYLAFKDKFQKKIEIQKVEMQNKHQQINNLETMLME